MTSKKTSSKKADHEATSAAKTAKNGTSEKNAKLKTGKNTVVPPANIQISDRLNAPRAPLRALDDIRKYHESISNELNVVRDRVRDLIRDPSRNSPHNVHWLSDGNFKEIILRNVLRRLLPDTVRCGTGFVVTGDKPSTQTDILIVDGRKPRLFEEGDFFIVTPDCVVAALEVKTKSDQLEEGMEHIADLAELVRANHPERFCWAGLFIYVAEDDLTPEKIVSAHATATRKSNLRVVNCCSAGEHLFSRYWDRDKNESELNMPCGQNVWHGYNFVGHRLAPAYLIGNVLQAVCRAYNVELDENIWFPYPDGKRSALNCCMGLSDTNPTRVTP